MNAAPVVVELIGGFDLSSAGQLAERLARVRDDPFVIVDLRAVTYLDSLAITELMRAHLNAVRAGGAIAIVSADERLARVLRIAGLTRVARLFDTTDLARAHLLALVL